MRIKKNSNFHVNAIRRFDRPASIVCIQSRYKHQPAAVTEHNSSISIYCLPPICHQLLCFSTKTVCCVRVAHLMNYRLTFDEFFFTSVW